MKLEEYKPLTEYKAINWNEVSDMIDKATWEKLTEQFWLDTRIPVSNDLDDWRELDTDHQWTVGHVFGGLTLLDTVQSEAGLTALKQDVKTQHETAVLNNIQFMESVHAKSYSTIFSTLNTPEEIFQILLKYGADPREKNNFGFSVMDRFQAYPKILKILQDTK